MCGITGILKKDAIGERDRAALGRMLKSLEARGPDGEGTFESEEVLLGSRRLAIVDVENGNQPLTFGNLTIVFNGEIYNDDELRRDFWERGIAFRTRSDTETLLRAYEVFGADCLKRIDGQFAFAVWDRMKRELFIARDRFGEKPLYYARTRENDLVFASTPTAVLEHPDVEAKPDPYTMGFFMLQSFTFAAGDAPLDRSFFSGISELPPGHFMVMSEEKTLIRRWYEFSCKDERPHGIFKVAELLREALGESVRKRVAKEVRNGIALSGGLDSSIVAALAKTCDSNIVASCISFQGDKNEDLAHARIAAAHNSMPLLETNTEPAYVRSIIDQMVGAMGSPHCMIRQIGMLENYRMLRDAGVKVALIGEGADELFFGYWHKFPGFKKDTEWMGKQGRFRELCRRRLDDTKKVFTPEFNSYIDYERAVDELCSPFEGFDSQDPMRRTQKFYLDHFLSSFLIRANDRLGMHSSIEPRLPFLSKKVVEIAMSMPISLNVSEQSEKLALREAFRKMLPEKICERRKSPLPAAIHPAFHLEIVSFLRDSMKSADASVWRMLSKEKIEDMCMEYEKKLTRQGNGRNLVSFRPLDGDFAVGTMQLFSVLTALRWHQRYLTKGNDGEFQSPPKKFQVKRFERCGSNMSLRSG
jgi:asparagine synthase (glutamine-hydrolysing)